MRKMEKDFRCGMNGGTPKKHPCPDCTFCQWCSDSRCNMCLRERKALSAAPKKNNFKKTKKPAKKKS